MVAVSAIANVGESSIYKILIDSQPGITVEIEIVLGVAKS
jgi:hypothetical protein